MLIYPSSKLQFPIIKPILFPTVNILQFSMYLLIQSQIFYQLFQLSQMFYWFYLPEEISPGAFHLDWLFFFLCLVHNYQPENPNEACFWNACCLSPLDSLPISCTFCLLFQFGGPCHLVSSHGKAHWNKFLRCCLPKNVFILLHI